MSRRISYPEGVLGDNGVDGHVSSTSRSRTTGYGQRRRLLASTSVPIVAPPLTPPIITSSIASPAAAILSTSSTVMNRDRTRELASALVRPQTVPKMSTTGAATTMAPSTRSVRAHSIVRDQFFLGDNLKVLSDPSNGILADAVITSPPYLLGRNPYHRAKGARDADFYSGGYTDGHAFWEKQPVEQYLNNMVTLFRLFENTVREDGPVILNLSYGIENPSLPQRVIIAIEDNTDYLLADTLAWNKLRTMPLQASPCNLTRIVEWVYIFCRKPYHKKFRTNKRVTKENWKQKFYEYVPNYIEAANTYDGPKCNLVAHFSTAFVDQLLSIYVPEESVVLDPFMGSGTTAVSCVRNNRHFIGIDVDPALVEVAHQRLLAEQPHNRSSVVAIPATDSAQPHQRHSNASQRKRRQIQEPNDTGDFINNNNSQHYQHQFELSSSSAMGTASLPRDFSASGHEPYEQLDQAESYLATWRRKISPTKDQYL